jgi:hypothetical protein
MKIELLTNLGYSSFYFQDRSIPEIEINSTPYKIFVLSLGENWKQNIVFLSLKFDLNIKEARQFKTSGKLLLTADAVRIFHVRQQLIDRGIEIIPKYPYEVWDNNPQGEFPMCTVEARKLKSLLEESQ